MKCPFPFNGRLPLLVLLLAAVPVLHAADKLKALIVDGQNNRKVRPKSTVIMKQYLEATDRLKWRWRSPNKPIA
jgi:hypothetical protein